MPATARQFEKSRDLMAISRWRRNKGDEILTGEHCHVGLKWGFTLDMIAIIS